MGEEQQKLNYEFAPTGNGEETGFNDSVTMMFRGNVYRSLAREPLQNIIDARTKLPAKAVYSLLKIKAQDLPKADDLKEIFKACKEYYVSTELDCFEFFKKAEEAIANNQDIYILKISDYNTRGLSGGDYDRNGDYYNFLKSSGASAKRNGGAGGSFGLGKGAYFANSSFRTIFVSSVYENNNCVFQGKLRLVTHLKNGEAIQGNGTFGYNGQLPVREAGFIPELFRREKQGTDIFIVGFEPEDNWKENLTRAVLNNFWYSIAKGILEVEIEQTKITESTLDKLMYEYFSEEQADTNENPNPLPYFNAYRDNENNIVFSEKTPILGEIKLYVLLRDRYPNKISYFRTTGMEIQRKKHLHFKAYAGTFICEDENGNAILRAMENPAHEEWNRDNCRAAAGQLPQDCAFAAQEIKTFIRESLNKLFKEEGGNALAIKGLEKYLNLSSDDLGLGEEASDEKDAKKTSADIETGTEIAIANEEKTKNLEIIRRVKVARAWKNIAKKNRNRNRVKKSDLKNKSGIQKIKIPIDVSSRAFAIKNDEGDVEHILKIKNMPQLQCDIELYAGTDASFTAVKIIKASNESCGTVYKTNKNIIYGVEPGLNGEADLKVIFEGNGKHSLNINVYKTL